MDFHGNGVAYGRIELTSATYSTYVERECDIVVSVFAKRADWGGPSKGSYEVYAPGMTPDSDYGDLSLGGKEWRLCGTYRGTVITDGNGYASVSITATVNVRSEGSGWFSSTGELHEVNCGIPPTLAGASTVSTGASTVQMGKPLLISIDRDDAYCRHTVEYSFGNASGTIGTDVGSSCQWNVPDLAEYCNNSLSGRCTINCKTYRNGNYLGSDSTDVTLTVQDPTIAQVNRGSFPLGSPSEVTTKRNSKNFRLQVYLGWQGDRRIIYEGKSDNWSWTPAYDLAAAIPNLTQGSGTIEVETYNGYALVGTEKTPVKITVPENDTTRPTLTTLTVSPVSTLPEQFNGLYLRGRTGVRAEITGESSFSQIATYSVSVGSSKVNSQTSPVTLDIINADGTVTVTATVTDLRGFTATKSTTIDVIPYNPPKVVPYDGYDSVICERCTETGALSPNGVYLAIRCGKKFTSVKLGGVEQNGCVLRYRWKESAAPDYGQWITLLGEDSPEAQISTVISNVVSLLSKSYQIELCAADKLGTEHVLHFSAMTEAVSFVLYDGVDGAAFGKYPEEPHVVDIASHMTLRVRGKLEVEGANWQDLGLIEHGGVSPSGVPHGRHEDTGCYCTLVNGNRVVVSFNCALDIGKTPAFVNAKELPAAWRPKRPVSSLIAIDDGMALVTVDPTGMILIPWADKWAEPTLPADWADGFIEYYV